MEIVLCRMKVEDAPPFTASAPASWIGQATTGAENVIVWPVVDPVAAGLRPVPLEGPLVRRPQSVCAGSGRRLRRVSSTLGSLTELLRPPAFPGPVGTPLVAAVQAPADPAFGEPAAVPVPADGPLAAPPAAPPAGAPPPAEPPLEPPPPLCASAFRGESNIATITSFAGSELDILQRSPEVIVPTTTLAMKPRAPDGFLLHV